MLAGWEELNRRFATFDRLLPEGTNLHDQIHAIGEAEHVTE